MLAHPKKVTLIVDPVYIFYVLLYGFLCQMCQICLNAAVQLQHNHLIILSIQRLTLVQFLHF